MTSHPGRGGRTGPNFIKVLFKDLLFLLRSFFAPALFIQHILWMFSHQMKIFPGKGNNSHRKSGFGMMRDTKKTFRERLIVVQTRFNKLEHVQTRSNVKNLAKNGHQESISSTCLCTAVTLEYPESAKSCLSCLSFCAFGICTCKSCS